MWTSIEALSCGSRISSHVSSAEHRCTRFSATRPSVESQKQRINDMVLTLLRGMAEHGVSHGDMKHTNILYDGTGVVLTDLDAMRIGGTGWLRRHRYRRDVNRYLRDL